jgi:hypothetical protein
MSWAWATWVAMWSERERPEPLAVFRIGVGLVLASTAANMLTSGVAVPLLAAAEHGGMAPDTAAPTFIRWLGGATPHVVTGLLGAVIALSLVLVVGAGGRLTPLVLGQLAIAMFAMHPGTGGGHDRLLTNGLWLMVLGPATATWSLDSKWRTGRWSDPTPILAMSRRLALWQLVYMYTLTGLQKQGAAWSLGGSWRALYYTLLLPTWARYDLRAVVPDLAPLLAISSWIAWWWETLWVALGLWLLAWHPLLEGTRLRRWVQRLPGADWRLPFVILGVITHGVLYVLMDLGPFSAVTMVYYVSLWTDDDTARLLTWWRGAGPAAD